MAKPIPFVLLQEVESLVNKITGLMACWKHALPNEPDGEDEESRRKQWSAEHASYDFLVAELEQFGSQEAEGGEDEDMTATQAGLEEAWSSSQISLFNGL